MELCEHLERFKKHQSEEGDDYVAEVLHRAIERIAQLESSLAEAREEKEVIVSETAGEYVARRIMDIFQEVAEHVGNGLFELDHPAPIIRGSIAMTNAWNAYLNETLNLPTNG